MSCVHMFLKCDFDLKLIFTHCTVYQYFRSFLITINLFSSQVSILSQGYDIFVMPQNKRNYVLIYHYLFVCLYIFFSILFPTVLPKLAKYCLIELADIRLFFFFFSWCSKIHFLLLSVQITFDFLPGICYFFKTDQIHFGQRQN